MSDDQTNQSGLERRPDELVMGDGADVTLDPNDPSPPAPGTVQDPEAYAAALASGRLTELPVEGPDPREEQRARRARLDALPRDARGHVIGTWADPTDGYPLEGAEVERAVSLGCQVDRIDHVFEGEE